MKHLLCAVLHVIRSIEDIALYSHKHYKELTETLFNNKEYSEDDIHLSSSQLIYGVKVSP